MKIAVSARESQVSGLFDSHFGRCAYFIFLNTETGEMEAYPNPAVDAGGGAGTLAAQFIVDRGAEVVISGRFGPNAYEALDAAGVKMHSAEAATVEKVLGEYDAGRLYSVKGTDESGRMTGRDHRNRSGV